MRERAQEDSHLIVGLVPMNQVFVFAVVIRVFLLCLSVSMNYSVQFTFEEDRGIGQSCPQPVSYHTSTHCLCTY